MPKEAAAFDKALLAVVRELHRTGVSERLSEDNISRYSHGRRWSHRASPYAIDGEMRTHSAEWESGFEELVALDLTLIPRFVEAMTGQFRRQFSEMMYSTVAEACDRSGNVVSAQNAGSFPAGFLEAMRRIEFSVGRDGTVSLPEIHLGSGTAQKMIAELEAQPPEYHAEMERLKAEKIAAALEREAVRKAKFKRGFS